MTIEDIVRSYVTIEIVRANGWENSKCAVCGDGVGKHKARGGWLFSGERLHYNCFNCGIRGDFDPSWDYPYGKEMYKIFQAYGIPINEVSKLIISAKKSLGKTPEKKKYSVQTIDIPDFFKPLSEASATNKIAKKAIELLEARHIDPKKYPFYLSSGKSKDVLLNTVARSYVGRLIIPYFKGNDLVYYQARALYDSKSKYINAPNAKRSSIIYGFDHLFGNEKFLFVTEGFFDAYHLKGASTLSDDISDYQIQILNSSKKTKIVVPDFNGDRFRLAKKAIELGWGISLPTFHESCKDVCDAIKYHGKLLTLQNIVDSISYGFKAEIGLKIYKNQVMNK